MMRVTVKTFLLLSVMVMATGSGGVSAQQIVQGNLKVSGTITADAVEANGGAVLTTKDLSAIQSQILVRVAEEITNRLKTNGNSQEMRAFSEQITNAIAKTIGVTRQELLILRRDLNDASKAGADSVNEMRAALANMQRAQIAAEREIASLRRELDQLRRGVGRR
jgi:hypothetical protein